MLPYRFFLFVLFAPVLCGVLCFCTLSQPPISYTLPSQNENPQDAGFSPPNIDLTSAEEIANILPYDFEPNMLTALTCPGNVNIGATPFTFQIKGQVHLSDDFKTENKIESQTESSVILETLNRSVFKRTRAVLSIQDENNLGAIYTNTSNNQPLQNFFPPFDNPNSLKILSETGTLSSTRRGAQNTNLLAGGFSASLPMAGMDLITMAPDLEQNSPGSPLITVTYTTDGKSILFKSANRPYGKGYKLRFGDPYKADYLTQVHEEDFLTEKVKDWDCRLVFTVHHATWPTESHFNRNLPTPAYQAHVPEGTPSEGWCDTRDRNLNDWEQWAFHYIFGTNDINKLPFKVGRTTVQKGSGWSKIDDAPCIKFNRGGCYQSYNSRYEDRHYRIEFDPDRLEDCIPITSSSNPETDRYKLCPGFLSICHKVRDN